ncbi:MAG: DUF4445 domain-containing protein [Ruminococcaceae bacterium]|nr:DUF4445 domain-containing protein [Oscillospiraceae bacterium]
MKHTVTVLPENRKLTADHGMSLYDLLILHGYYIPAACQGRGVCGKCKVTLISGTPTGTSPDEDGMLLSCRAYVTEDLVIRYTAQNATQTVFKEGATVTADIGAVLDIGTTTLAMRLYSLENGNLLGESTALNPQGVCGADVLSRIDAWGQGKGALLQELILQKTKEMLRSLSQDFRVKELTVAANPTMLHLFLGVDPTPIGTYPFTPAFLCTQRLDGKTLGLPADRVTLLPFTHAYIGSDVTAGILYCNLHRSTKNELFVDIGTNGELVLSKHGTLLSASCAAGPALEGACIECGTGGIPGAVSHVSFFGGELLLETVEDHPPVGICGSGLIDLISVLVSEGLIDESGAWDTESESALASRLHGDRLYLCEGIYLSQADIRQFQLAKSAISAGIKALLHEANLSPEALDTVYVAGGLGFYMNMQNAQAVDFSPVFRTHSFKRLETPHSSEAPCALETRKSFVNWKRFAKL